MSTTEFNAEVEGGDRFEFGKNWKNFLKTLDEKKIKEAENSLISMLGVQSLEGKSFLDIGSGSGLFSLAARNLGASVVSFDYDDSSVWCTHKLRSQFYDGDNEWDVKQGSILDEEFLDTLPTFDFVYSWGVLHHTGNMWMSLKNTSKLVNEKGVLFISLYNYQPLASRYWRIVKKLYNQVPMTRPFWILIHFLYPTVPSILLRILQRRNLPRGMNIWYDLLDWLGGYPFEVSTPQEIFSFYKSEGFVLSQLKTVGGKSGCNEYVFNRNVS